MDRPEYFVCCKSPYDAKRCNFPELRWSGSLEKALTNHANQLACASKLACGKVKTDFPKFTKCRVKLSWLCDFCENCV